MTGNNQHLSSLYSEREISDGMLPKGRDIFLCVVCWTRKVVIAIRRESIRHRAYRSPHEQTKKKGMYPSSCPTRYHCRAFDICSTPPLDAYLVPRQYYKTDHSRSTKPTGRDTACIMSSETRQPVPPVRILIINPNTSTHMTDALRPVVDDLGYPSVRISSSTHTSRFTLDMFHLTLPT